MKREVAQSSILFNLYNFYRQISSDIKQIKAEPRHENIRGFIYPFVKLSAIVHQLSWKNYLPLHLLIAAFKAIYISVYFISVIRTLIDNFCWSNVLKIKHDEHRIRKTPNLAKSKSAFYSVNDEEVEVARLLRYGFIRLPTFDTTNNVIQIDTMPTIFRAIDQWYNLVIGYAFSICLSARIPKSVVETSDIVELTEFTTLLYFKITSLVNLYYSNSNWDILRLSLHFGHHKFCLIFIIIEPNPLTQALCIKKIISE